MHTMNLIRFIRMSFLPLFLFAASFFVSCSEEPTTPTDQTDTVKALDSIRTLVSADITNNVILPTYLELRDKVALLRDAAAAYSSAPTEANWLATRAAWHAARNPWESCEAFIFGPADFKALDPALDLWPLNRTDLDSIIVGTISLHVDSVSVFNDNVKGSHAAEYLLFGDSNQKVFSQMTSREIEYLVGVTADMAKNTKILYDSWSPAGENYAALFQSYPNSRYSSPKDGLSEMLQGMIDLSVELYGTKMEGPYSSRELKYDESAFSDNSIVDFIENVNSIKRMYTGVNGSHSGKGISFLVQRKDAALDIEVREVIATCETAILNITPTFGKAITVNRPAIEAAITAVERLYQILENEVKPIVTQ